MHNAASVISPIRVPSATRSSRAKVRIAQKPADQTMGQGSHANISTEQRTRIRQTIVKESNAPRVTNVNFTVSVGTVVPRTVRLAPIPVTVIEVMPAWRGYDYFLVGDDIIVVEPGTLRIVAVIPA